MSAPLKRRRVLYYLSLPIVITVLFLLAAKLVAIERAEIIEELSDRVAHHDPEDASAAVRQLGEMSRPPVSVLVDAAAAADRKLARDAKQTIDKILRRAQQQLEAGRGTKAIARQLTELARELADHRHAFPVSDRPWLVGTTQRILRLANQVPSKHAPIVAANCDLILTSIPTVAAVATGSAEATALTSNTTPTENEVVSETTSTNTPADDAEPADEGSTDPIFVPWRADKSEPVFRVLPASPEDLQPVDPTTSPTPSYSPPPELPAGMETIGRPMTRSDTRFLLQRLHETNGGVTPQEQQLRAVELIALHLALKQRGFDRPPPSLLNKLFSTPEDRLQLVDAVLQEPTINARPWLILLADDADAEVRLAALTIMATSTDAALVEQAWQAAIHDPDPRVAALAHRLRERREAIQRR